ncbi:unnamed protein product [Arabis nemorensis]|uniref:AP2/ERF domain-containing protein n=1 Tax=Arabis nemorensis TaxID=586526 RepID=A0A565BBK8_9BRAS|nr:unnamed protein product [Arabis nemorensis]
MSAVSDSAVISSLSHISFPIQSSATSSALFFGLTTVLNALRFCSKQRFILEVPSISMGLRPKRDFVWGFCGLKKCESDMKPNRKVLLRKVRIIVNDPYATDDSSGDEWIELPKPPKVKRIVHEITVPFQLSVSSQDRCGTTRKRAPRQSNNPVGVRLRQSSNPVGVRLRQSGKWAAEIKNPITRTKKWLGTFETREEAEKAYADKKLEYDALASSSWPVVSTSVVSVSSQCLRSPSASAPCASVDDLSKEKVKDAYAASGDSTKEMFFNFDFSDLQIPDLSFLATEEESMVSSANGEDLDFDSFLMDEDSAHLLDDFSLLDNDINIDGFENSVPSELPDYDFTDGELELGDSTKFAFADQLAPPLNVAYP